jgi:polyisoprenoid-binding protein YceI
MMASTVPRSPRCREPVRRLSRHAGVALSFALLMALASCGTRPSPSAQPVAANRPAGTTPFQLDASASEIWLFLRADGPMAKVGHTHVITTHGLQGNIWLHPQAELSGCAFELPVSALVVDDPQERAAAGAEFAEPLDEQARSSTREHMLGNRQLDAAQYPEVSMHCRQLSAASGGITVQLNVTLRGHESQLSVPVQWQRDGNSLHASGEFTFTQSSLGLEPYSLLFGALRVSDQIRARFRLVARTS